MVRVDATPAGCVVMVDGLMVGVAPCNYVVSRRGELQFEVLPPRDNKDELFVQKKTVHWSKLPATGAVLYFDLRLDKTAPGGELPGPRHPLDRNFQPWHPALLARRDPARPRPLDRPNPVLASNS